MVRYVNFRPVLFSVGVLLAILAAAMCIPALADALAHDPNWKVFASAAAATLFIAISLILTTREARSVLSPRQSLIMVTSSWLAISLFGALPFLFSDAALSFSDAFFESASGITTTGATVLTGLEGLSPGLLLWRGMLQWLGGVGLVVVAIFVLPELRVGGMQSVRPSESLEETGRLGTLNLGARIVGVYVAITIIGGVILALLGLRPLDAIVHAMTSVATGGFSNYDRSVAHFESGAIELVLILLMLAGACPFIQFLRALTGTGVSALSKDGQIRWMFMTLFISVAVLVAWRIYDAGLAFGQAIRPVAFNTVSMMTGTGYTTAAYDTWGALPMLLLAFLMITGGCSGSTCSGLKVFRIRLLLSALRTQFHRLYEPQAVHLVRYDGRPVSDGLLLSVLALFGLYMISILVCAMILASLGLDAVSAISGSISAIANIGPAYGPLIGPLGNYASLSDPIKWVLSVFMILGRLELYAILVLFFPSFWRD